MSLVSLVGVSVLYLAVLVLGLFRWRIALKLTFWTVIAEGMIRKWLFPHYEMELYFLRDVQLFGVVVGYCREEGAGRFLKLANRIPFWLRGLLYAFFFYSLAQVFNPFFALPQVAWFGFKTYTYYLVISLLLPEVWQDRQTLERDLRGMALVGLPMAVLCCIQYFAPPESFINLYSNPDTSPTWQGLQTPGGKIITATRSCGTFSYIGTAGAFYCVLAFVVSASLLTAKKWGLRDLLFSSLLVLGVVLCAVTTGARAVLVLVFAVLATGLVLLLFSDEKFGALLRRYKFWLLASALVLAAGVSLSGLDLVFKRFQSGDNLVRIIDTFNIFDTDGLHEPWFVLYGGGIGTTNPGEIALLHHLLPGNLASMSIVSEFYKYRIRAEVGLVGYYCWVAFQLGCIAYALLGVRTTTVLRERSLYLLIAVYLALNLTNSMMTDYIFNLGFWLILGLLISLRNLPKATTV